MKRILVRQNSEVFVGEYLFNTQLKEELCDILENHSDVQSRKTHVKATMTDWEWDPKSDRLKRLKNRIKDEILVNFSDVADFKSELFLKYVNFWGNVYRKGDYTNSHHHQANNFSFVYFLKAKWYYPPLVFTESGKKIRPKEGRYVIFPGHLLHHVPKQWVKETRITLSANLDIVK